MKAKIVTVGFGLLAAGAVLAAADPAKIKELNETISKNYVSFGIWNAGYLRYHAGYKSHEGDYGPRVDTKGYLAMRERYLKALAEKESLLPGDAEWLDEAKPMSNVIWGEALAAIPEFVRAGKPSPTGRHTFTTWHHWRKGEKLLSSGLLGPVRLVVETAESRKPAADAVESRFLRKERQ